MKLLIKNGLVIDPANKIHELREVWIENGKLAAPSERADEIIDAAGKVVCPGFIDIHMHEDPLDAAGRLLAYDETSVFACMLHMGVTTAVAGNCGENKAHPADYLDLVARDGAPVNVAMLAGHGFFRELSGCRDRYAPATAAERLWMARELERALSRGCLGISYGIRYQPGMDARELAETAACCRGSGKLLAAHIRDDAAQVFSAAREFLDAALPLDTPLQLSHIGSMAGFGQMREFLALLDGYRQDREDIRADCYPYAAFSTTLGSATYDEGWRERYGCGYEAVELCLDRGRGTRCDEALFRRMRAERPECVTVCHVMRQDEVDLALRHGAVMVASDSTLDQGRGHPRACGTFPRVLSRYVANGVLSLDEAIAKMTALPARQLGLKNKGNLSQGSDADIVIFDPNTVLDLATFDEPLAAPRGIERVLLAGKTVLKDGAILNRHTGTAVRG